VREDGRIVGGEGWQEKIHNKEERKKLLRTARNCRILHMPMECVTKDIHNKVLKKCTNLWRHTQGQHHLAVVIKSSGLNTSVSNTVPTLTINGIS